ncbi:MAG: PAS domain-containing protein [Pseudomonadota bacterium]
MAQGVLPFKYEEELRKSPMKDQSKTSQKLIQELDYLRQRIAALEQPESEHNRAEDALQASEELLRVLTENSPSMIYLLDARGYVRFVNEKSAAQFGMKADAIIGRNVCDLFPERIAEQYMQSLQKVVGNSETIHSELSGPVPTGKRWNDAHITPVRDKNGTIIAVLGISHVTGLDM